MSRLALRPSTTFGGRTPGFADRPIEADARSRDAVRLLVASGPFIRHRRFGDLVDELRAGDVLVVNTSATVNGEVDASWRGMPIVLHATEGPFGDWVVELRSAPDAGRSILDAAPGDHVAITEGPGLRLLAPHPHRSSPTGEGNRLWRAEAEGGLRALLDAVGRPIAYGYLAGRWPLAAYQTVFGQVPGSAEMASAGRPFTDALVQALLRRGVLIAPVLLHTGFSSQEAGEGPQPERFEVGPATARTLNLVRRSGGRVVAVGTTATRAVESAVVGGRVLSSRGWTDRVVTPAEPPQIVNGLITGWHDAGASHLLLVEAIAGAEKTQRAYDAALAKGYAWHEFGDSCLIL